MLTNRIEAKRVDAFVRVFEPCKVQPVEPCALFCETRSRPVLDCTITVDGQTVIEEGHLLEFPA